MNAGIDGAWLSDTGLPAAVLQELQIKVCSLANKEFRCHKMLCSFLDSDAEGQIEGGVLARF